MKVVLCEPHKEAVITEIDGSLEDMQEVVGGLIEPMYLDDEVVAICNEEGKLVGLDLNRAIFNEKHEIADIIAGTFFVVAAPADSDSFASLSDEVAAKYLDLFKRPQAFFMAVDEQNKETIKVVFC